MEPVSSAILAGSTLAASGVSAGSAAANSARSYKYTRRLQKHQFEFQERMANTAHQREKADLIAAGMNPTLTATGGAGAATPSGGMSGVSASDSHLGDAIVDAASSALDYKQKKQELQQQRDLIDSTIGKNEADATKANKDSENNTRLTDKQIELLNAQIENIGYSNSNSAIDLNKRNYLLDLELQLGKEELKGMLNDAAFDNSGIGRVLKGLKAGGEAASAVVSPFFGLANSAANYRGLSLARDKFEYSKLPETNVTRTYDRKGRHVSTRTSTTAR